MSECDCVLGFLKAALEAVIADDILAKDVGEAALQKLTGTAERSAAFQLGCTNHLVFGMTKGPRKRIKELWEENKEDALIFLRDMADEFQ